jgi:hypothetical protein
MAVQLYLSQGDGATSNYVDLSTAVERNTLAFPTPGPGERTRSVSCSLTLNGSDSDAAWDTARAIQQMLYLAQRAAGPYGVGSGITLGVRLDTTRMVYFDILSGSFDFREVLDRARRVIRGTLTLECLRYLRGDAVTAPVTATLTNGAMTWTLDAVQGDAPAPCRITMTDESTGAVIINGLRIGAKSLPGLGSSDFDPIFDLSAAGSGMSETDATALGGTVAKLTPTLSWADMAETSVPGTAYSIGLYDLYVRMYDETTSLSAPQGLALSTSPIRTSWVTAGTAASINLAMQPVAGELLVGVVKTGGATVTVAPSGYSLRDSHSAAGVQTYIYEKIATGSETAFTATLSGSGVISVYVAAIIGTPASSYADKTVKNTGTGTSATPSTTGVLAQAAEIVLLVTGAAISTNLIYTPPANYSEVRDTSGLGIAWEVTAATTALNPATTISSSQTWVCHCVTYLIDLEGAATSSAPGLTVSTATYVRVAARSAAGGIGEVCVAVNTTPSTGNLHVFGRWTAPVSGTPASYRIWWKQGANAWRFYDTDDTQPQFVVLNNTLGTEGDPPNTIISVTHLLRAAVSLGSGTTRFETPSVTASRANNTRELLYLGTVPLPPAPLLEAGSGEDALVTIQAKAQAETVAGVVVDAVYLFPHDEAQLSVYRDGYDLAAKHDWLIDTRRDGVVTARLYTDGTTTEAGQPVIDGAPFLIGPGNVRFVAHVDAADGASDFVDAKAIFTVRYVPQFLTLRGVD